MVDHNYLNEVCDAADIKAAGLNLLLQVVNLRGNVENQSGDWAWCNRFQWIQLSQNGLQKCANARCVSGRCNGLQVLQQSEDILQLNSNWSSYSSSGIAASANGWRYLVQCVGSVLQPENK